MVFVQLVLAMQAAAFGSGTNTLTRGMATAVLDWKVKHHAEDVETLDREKTHAAPTTGSQPTDQHA